MAPPISKQDRTLSIDDGRFSYLVAGRRLGWERLTFTIETAHAGGTPRWTFDTPPGPERFRCLTTSGQPGQIVMQGKYPLSALEETITLHLLENGALRVERRIENKGGVSQVVRSAACGTFDGLGGPVFTDNHFWRARFAHMDNVRTEDFPWSRPEFPYLRPIPRQPTVHGLQDSQPAPVMLLTNDTCSQLLLEGQLRQDRTRVCWTLAAGPRAVTQTYQLQWSMSTGGIEVGPGGSLELEPVYYQILENTHPQDSIADYYAAVASENKLLPADDVLLTKAFYCSWNYGILENISEESLLKTARFIGKNMPAMKHFIIDGGWQNEEKPGPSGANFYLPEGQWHNPERFPRGMKAVADGIRAAGLSPALWWTPAIALHSRLAQEHPEWLAKDARGDIYRIKSSGYLDYSLPAVQEYFHTVFDIIFRQWGFEGLKLDFYSQSVESPHIRYATGTGVEWRDWLLGTIRSYLPQDGLLMSCVAVAMGNPFLGKHANTYRCSIDVGNATWGEHVMSCVWNLPLLSIPGRRACLLNVDGLGWNMALSDDENLHRLTYGFITMGSLEIDGRLEELPADKVAILNRLIADMDRGHPVRCPDLDAFTGNGLPDCLYVDYPPDSATGRRGVKKHLALFNWSDEARYVGYPAEALGLSGDVEARDYWTDEKLRFISGDVCLKLNRRSGKLFEI